MGEITFEEHKSAFSQCNYVVGVTQLKRQSAISEQFHCCEHKQNIETICPAYGLQDSIKVQGGHSYLSTH